MSINLWFDYYNSMSSAEYWTNFISGVGTDVSYDVTTDSTKNIYTAGTTGTGYSNIHYTSSDIFNAFSPFSGYLVKYDPYGQPLWRTFVANTQTPSTNIVTSNAVVAFGSSSVYVAGGSTGFADIYDKNGSSVGSVPRNCGYLVKYDIDGNFLWRTFIANTQTTITTTGAAINSIAVDSSENVYVFGVTGGSAATTVVHSNIYQASDTFPLDTLGVGFRQGVANNPQSYVIKFDSNGNFQWRAFIDNLITRTINEEIATSGTVDSNGDVYISGYTGNVTATVYTSAVTPTSSGLTITSNAAYLVKYSSLGEVKWRSLINDVTASIPDYSYGVATDSLNNVYIVGNSGTTAAATINSSNIYSDRTSGITISTNSAYIVKYGPSGNFLWRASIDGTGTDVSFHVTTDIDRNVIVTGAVGVATASIINSSGQTVGSIPANSSFVVKYDENGNFLNRYFFSPGTGYAVATDIDKNIITVGTIGNSSGFIYNSNQDSDCFTGYTIPQGSSYVTKHNQFGVIPLSTGVYRTLVSNGWAVNWSNSTPCASFGCFVSPDGNSVYKVGNVSGTTVSILSNSDRSFSGYTIPSSTGCIVKYDSSGNFQWRSYVLGTSSNVLCVHGDNSTVFIGGTSGTSSATLHDIYGNINYTYPSNTGFIVKYNSSGGIDLKSYVSNSTINSVFLTLNGFYVGGLTHPSFTSNIVDNSDTVVGELPPRTGFLLKFDTSLTYNWQVRFNPSTGTAWCPVTSVSSSVSDSDAVYAAGYSNAAVQVNYTDTSSTGTLLPAARSTAAFVSKFDNLGVFQWKSYVDSLTAGSAEIGTGVKNESSNVFFTGFTGSGTASAYNNSDTIYGGLRPINAVSAFLIKYNSSGDLLWYSNITGGATITTSNCITVDSNGDVYIGGRGGSGGTISHSNIYGSITSGVSVSINNGYISKYDGRTGQFIWRSTIGDTIRSISIDSSNYIYTSGFTGATGATVFNSNSVASSLSIPASSSFMVKYKPNGAIVF